MEPKKKRDLFMPILCIIIFLIICYLFADMDSENNGKKFNNDSDVIRIISSSENEDLEPIIQNYAKQKGYKISIDYAGTLDITEKLNNEDNNYDGVWLSNSIWMYTLNNKVKTSDSKCTSINPIVFGIKKSKAQELGFIGKTVYTRDIVDAISNGKLKFSMSNPTSTNSGASAYLGLLYTLAGNPEVLTKDILNNEVLKENLKTLFSGMERSSGSEDFLEELFLKGDYEAVVTYESSIININNKLTSEGKEPLYAIYPVDGVSISDSPLAFISNNNTYKKDAFLEFQKYILSDEGQRLLQEKGRRTWYGGISNNVDKNIFNPEWGIDTTRYISPVKYPSTEVIRYALNLYQVELKKPTHVVFCLDYSGSMYGDGYKQLVNAMEYILTDRATENFIQFSSKDKIDVILFGSDIIGIWSTDDGSKTDNILNQITSNKPNGTTALYTAAEKALEILQKEDSNIYNLSIVLMTDGLANVGTYSSLASTYSVSKKKIPIYSIMFGKADESQLSQIANLTNAKVFDGKTDLIKAFKEVRGYN